MSGYRGRHRRATADATVVPDGTVTPRHRARKRFGQHFLQAVWAERVVKAIAPTADEVVLEIGPGPGAITVPLLAACRHVVAFEIDRDLAATLRSAGHANLTVVEGDFLHVSASAIADQLRALGLEHAPLRLAGNLPYNVASPILFKCAELVEAGLPIRDTTVMLQREVADRLLAQPGTSEYGVLAVLFRHVAGVERRLNLPPGAFRPSPDVHSSVVTLRWHAPDPPPRDLALFRGLTRAVFTRRRKTLSNALQAWGGQLPGPAGELLLACGIDPQRRPETLDIPEFVRLADAVAGPRPA